MRNFSLWFFALFSMVASADGLVALSQVPIQGMTVVEKTDQSVLNPHCSAHRQWQELRSPAPFAVDAVNARIRKDLTVGKKLRDADCDQGTDDPASVESWDFVNWAQFTGRWKGLVGVREVINFPGGLGACIERVQDIRSENGKNVYNGILF